MSKRVSFTEATEYNFKLGHNGSTLTSDSIPGIGLVGKHITSRKVKISALLEKKPTIMRYTSQQRMFFLKRDGLTKQNVLDEVKENYEISEEIEKTRIEEMQIKALQKSSSNKRNCREEEMPCVLKRQCTSINCH